MRSERLLLLEIAHSGGLRLRLPWLLLLQDLLEALCAVCLYRWALISLLVSCIAVESELLNDRRGWSTLVLELSEDVSHLRSRHVGRVVGKESSRT